MDFDFPETLPSAEASKIPQAFRPLYTEQDGNFVLDKADVKVSAAVAAAMGLNQALKAARNENKTLKGSRVDLSLLAEYGTTPEEIAAKIQEEIGTRDQVIAKNSKVDPEKIRADLAKSFQKDIETRDGKIGALSKQLTAKLVDAEAIGAIAELKGTPELLLPFIKQQVKVQESKGGELEVVVVDAQGDVRFGANGPMSIKDLVTEMKGQEKFGKLFDSEAPQGGGKPPGSGTGNKPRQGEELSSTDKIRRGLANLQRR